MNPAAGDKITYKTQIHVNLKSSKPLKFGLCQLNDTTLTLDRFQCSLHIKSTLNLKCNLI